MLKKAAENKQGKRKRRESTTTYPASTHQRLDAPLPSSPLASTVYPGLSRVGASAGCELSKFEQLRVDFKTTSSGLDTGSQKKKKGKQAEWSEGMSVEMENLVNAGTRPFKCHHAPITALYVNDRFGES